MSISGFLWKLPVNFLSSISSVAYLIVLQVITGQVCFFSQSIIYGLKIALLHHIKGLQHTGACTWMRHWWRGTEQPVNRQSSCSLSRTTWEFAVASQEWRFTYVTGITSVNVVSLKLGKTCERILRMSLSVWLELICPSRSSAVRHWEAKLATLLPS